MQSASFWAAAALLWFAFSGTAYAYLDPGTGSLVLQILLGGAAGLLVGWKFFWVKIKSIIGLEPKGKLD